MHGTLSRHEIQALITDHQWPRLREAVHGLVAPELADLLNDLGKTERALLFRALPRTTAADVFAYLEPEEQDGLLRDLTDQETRHLLSNLSPDDRTALLLELPAEASRRMLGLLSPGDLTEARQLLGYPEESVGRLMTPDYVAIRPEWTVGRALQHVRERGKDSETINVLYVVDGTGRLLDEVRLRRIILADPEQPVASVMDHSFVHLSAFDDREEAVRKMRRYDIVAVPVLDSDGVLIGIVTVDDALDVAEEEATEDVHKAASVLPLRASYKATSAFALYRKRILWLAALVVVNLAASGVIAAHEEVLASTLALAFFIPLLIDSGGNTGSQSAMLMIRALVTDDLKANNWARALAKETLVGLLLGASLGIMTWGLGLYRGGPEIAVVVAVAMAAVVVTANLVGTLLPFLLVRFGIDPTVASSPLITSIMDTTGLLIYFTVASALL